MATTGPELGAQTDRPLRGDYSRAAADFTVDLRAQRYTEADRELWARLVRRQQEQLPAYACPEFLTGLERSGCDDTLPDLPAVSARLQAATGWRLVGVPGFIPDAVFFRHLAARQFPVTVWLRRPEEFDYLVEPDLFHDFFGHVPMLFDPRFAAFVQRYGELGLKALALDALPLAARLYWYTVEFGLIDTPQGLRAYGSGILSSAGETPHSVASAEPLRLRFDLVRCLRTAYRIDAFQQTYFVIECFETLADLLADDLGPLLARLRDEPVLPADRAQPGDRLFTIAATPA